MLKQEIFYLVASWGCVTEYLGLPAELNPQMYALCLTTCVIIPAGGTLVNSFLKIFCSKRSPQGVYPAGIEKAGECSFGKNYALACLTVKDLRSHTAQQHSGHHGEQGLGQHIAAVVGQAVSPCGQTIVQVAPDQHAGQKAAHKAQETGGKGAHGHAHGAVLEGTGEQLGQTQCHKGQHIVQQHLTEEVEEGGSGRRVEAHDHLQAGVHETGEQAPLCAVAEGHQHKGQHAQQGDAAAVGHGEELDVGKHRANGDHQGAFHQNTGLGIGFGHDEKIPLS